MWNNIFPLALSLLPCDEMELIEFFLLLLLLRVEIKLLYCGFKISFLSLSRCGRKFLRHFLEMQALKLQILHPEKLSSWKGL